MSEKSRLAYNLLQLYSLERYDTEEVDFDVALKDFCDDANHWALLHGDDSTEEESDA